MKRKGERIFQITAPHFCAGVFVEKVDVAEKIHDAAPILKWSIGWEWPRFRGYCFRKGWRIREASKATSPPPGS